MMNRIDRLFREKKKEVLSIFFTAGYPEPESTGEIMRSLQEAGADMVEIGMPYSDPLADGPVIQASSMKALENGMSLKKLFEQLEKVMPEIRIPVILMGYLNPVLQMGFEEFCRNASRTGVSGIILPDLPPVIAVEEYRGITDACDLKNILLISPHTTEERIRFIDEYTGGFIYLVSSPSVTGDGLEENPGVQSYFERIQAMKLKHPQMVGFGISSPERFRWVSRYASGGIIGSAFVNAIGRGGPIPDIVRNFVQPFITVK